MQCIKNIKFKSQPLETVHVQTLNSMFKQSTPAVIAKWEKRSERKFSSKMKTFARVHFFTILRNKNDFEKNNSKLNDDDITESG